MSSKIFVKIHAVLRKLHMIKHMTTLTMCPMIPMCPILQGAPSLSSVLTMIPICPHYDHVPNCPCAPLPMCPIPQGIPSLSLILHMIPLCPYVPLPMCPVAHIKKDVKLSERCQAVKKMSICQKDVKCQKVKHMDYGGGSQKK